MAILQLSLLDTLVPDEKDLGYGGLSLVVEVTGDKPKIRIRKISDNMKNPGTKREQSFYIHHWELNSLADILENIVETNNLK